MQIIVLDSFPLFWRLIRASNQFIINRFGSAYNANNAAPFVMVTAGAALLRETFLWLIAHAHWRLHASTLGLRENQFQFQLQSAAVALPTRQFSSRRVLGGHCQGRGVIVRTIDRPIMQMRQECRLNKCDSNAHLGTIS